MLKPIIQIYPVLPADSEEHRAQLRPIGRNKQIYQDTLLGWHDIVKYADEIGFWGVATIEHHFWSEGYEVGPNPGVMDAYWAAITKNVRVGQLGYVMSTQNPIRVAEETAIIDHLAKGRSFVGFARGYQSRWTNVLGQHYGTTATKSPSAAKNNPATVGVGFAQTGIQQKDLDQDAKNREVFEEQIDIVRKAWTQESFAHKGKIWQIPYPADTGVADWQLAHTGVTERLGAPNELGPNNSIKEISVCPAPYQTPHPPVFVSGSGSPETIEYCARNGFIPVYFTNITTAGPLSQSYLRIANENGYKWKPGQNQCLVRWMQMADTEEEARKNVIAHDFDIWKNFYAAMGRRRLDMKDVFGSMMESGLYVVGTPEQVRDELVKQWKVFPAEYMTLIFHYAQMPKDKVMWNMKAFNEVVKPALDAIVADAQGSPAAAAQ